MVAFPTAMVTTFPPLKYLDKEAVKMSIEATIWHYPRCSKSRKTLAILRDKEAAITLRPYLDDPPTVQELAQAVDRLNISPEALVRKTESLFKELDADTSTFDDQQWLELLARHPKLIERPLVFTDAGAVIGRPPENVQKILPGRSK